MSADPTHLQQAKDLLTNADRIFAITGAGISAESGVPTFRGQGGVWKNVNPEEVATPEAFARNPQRVWEWYDARRVDLLEKQPNPGHEALARLEQNTNEWFLLTQNVDDLHEQAGSQSLWHIHGSIWQVRCIQEGNAWEDRTAPFPELPPTCPQCGAMLRPNVTWFGEVINENALAATERFLSDGEADVVLVIGTEASFGYIAYWVQQARGVRGRIIEVNPGKTMLSGVADVHLQAPSGEVLPQVVGS